MFGNLIVVIFFFCLVHYYIRGYICLYSVGGLLLQAQTPSLTPEMFVINGAQIFKLLHPCTIFLVVIKHLQINILPQPDTKTKHYNGYGWSLHDYYVRLVKKNNTLN